MVIAVTALFATDNERKNTVKAADKLSDYLYENARGPLDTDAAMLLRKLGQVYDTAREMCYAKTHEHSRAAYMEMIDLIKGKPNE